MRSEDHACLKEVLQSREEFSEDGGVVQIGDITTREVPSLSKDATAQSIFSVGEVGEDQRRSSRLQVGRDGEIDVVDRGEGTDNEGQR